LEKQVADTESERLSNRSNIEQLQNQMAEMQASHQRARDEYERILKQIKQENERLNEQVKQHLTEQPSAVVSSRKSSVLILRSFLSLKQSRPFQFYFECTTDNDRQPVAFNTSTRNLPL
jgi:septal ring factor EnvC (AmiA/AmiB activator)